MHALICESDAFQALLEHDLGQDELDGSAQKQDLSGRDEGCGGVSEMK